MSTPVSSLQIVAVVSFYIVAAILMVTVNKWVLITTAVPIFFLFVQLAVAVGLFLLCRLFKFITLPQWDTVTVKKLAPLIAVNVCGLVFNNLCLKYVDASFYQVARGLVLPITVGLAFAFQQSPPSIRAAACCAGVSLGFGVGVMWDNYASKGGAAKAGYLGIFFGILSSCTTALHSIVIKASLPHVDNSAIQLAWFTNLLSSAAIVPVFLLMGEARGVLAMLGDPTELAKFTWGGAITGVVGFMICIAGLLSIKVTSPVTHMVSSAARGVVQTLLSVWFFGDIITGARASSILLITMASMAYVWVKHTENQPADNKVLFEQEEEEVPLTSRRKGEEEV